MVSYVTATRRTYVDWTVGRPRATPAQRKPASGFAVATNTTVSPSLTARQKTAALEPGNRLGQLQHQHLRGCEETMLPATFIPPLPLLQPPNDNSAPPRNGPVQEHGLVR